MITFLITFALTLGIVGASVYGGMILYKYYLENIKNHTKKIKL